MARGQNLLEKIYNKPLLITTDALQPITDYLSSPDRVASLKMVGNDTQNTPQLSEYESDEKYRNALLRHYNINPETMTGVLNIDGVLVNREGQLNAQCVELTSYQGLKKQFEIQVAQGIKSCVLMISSVGGEAFAAWSTASYVKKIAKQNNVKLTTYINGSASSAAYVWAVVADEIVSHPMGSAGSIGVLVQLYNDSKHLEKIGVSRSFVYAGGNKIPFDKDGGFTDKFIADLQKSVNNTYDKFVNHVVENRNMSRQQVIDTNASVFDADEAIQLGLIDKIMELEDFEIEYGIKTTKSTANFNNLKLSTTGKNMKTVEQLTTELEGANASLSVANATIESKDKELNTLTESLTAEQAAKAELASEIETLKQSLKDEQEAKESLSAEIAKMKADALAADRKAKLTEVLGSQNEQLDTLLTTTASLDDAAFSAIVSAMSTKIDKEDQEMNEIGQKGKEQKMDSDPFSDALKKSIQRNS